MKPALLIRADGSAAIGSGHVMRCLALAQKWKSSGAKVVFAHAASTKALEDRLQAEGMEVLRLNVEPGTSDDARATIQAARENAAAWVVADGYAFGAAWQQEIKAAGLRLLLVDDCGGAEHYFADLVLNQNAFATPACYEKRESTTRLLLGTRYVLLRREFLGGRRCRTERKAANRVLVTLGGSDPRNATGKIIEGLALIPGIEATVVVGGSNPNLPLLQQATRACADKIRLAVNPPSMPELMEGADIAVSAAGSTCWELAFLGVPAIVTILADNQEPVANDLARRGIVVCLGRCASLTSERIAEAVSSLLSDEALHSTMSKRGQQLVDGHGVSRVIARMRANEIGLRHAGAGDCRMIWQWANDPKVRASAFSGAEIPWSDHLQWFERKTQERSTMMFIGSAPDGTPLGQARFECQSTGVAEIDVSVDSRLRRSGLGSALICRAVDEVFSRQQIRSVLAYVKPENEASIRAFTNAGFSLVGHTRVHGHDAVRLTMNKSDD